VKIGEPIRCRAVWLDPDDGKEMRSGFIACTLLGDGDDGKVIYVKCSHTEFHDKGKHYRTLYKGALESARAR
jgi:hypothetical protein